MVAGNGRSGKCSVADLGRFSKSTKKRPRIGTEGQGSRKLFRATLAKKKREEGEENGVAVPIWD